MGQPPGGLDAAGRTLPLGAVFDLAFGPEFAIPEVSREDTAILQVDGHLTVFPGRQMTSTPELAGLAQGRRSVLLARSDVL